MFSSPILRDEQHKQPQKMHLMALAPARQANHTRITRNLHLKWSQKFTPLFPRSLKFTTSTALGDIWFHECVGGASISFPPGSEAGLPAGAICLCSSVSIRPARSNSSSCVKDSHSVKQGCFDSNSDDIWGLGWIKDCTWDFSVRGICICSAASWEEE